MVDDGFEQDRLLQISATGERPFLAIVGDTLLMDTVEAYLSKNTMIDVVRVQTDVADTGKYLTSLSPDLIIFDWDAPQTTYLMSFLRDRGHIPLVGLDLHSNKAIVLSTRLNTVRTADQLYLIIQEQIRHRKGDSEVLFNREYFERYFQRVDVTFSVD